MRTLFSALALFALVALLPAAPKGKPDAPEFAVETVTGRWDGDVCNPWLYVTEPTGQRVYKLAFPTEAMQQASLRRFTRDDYLAATGMVGTTGIGRAMLVSELSYGK
jgi:hypothetical protein